LTRVKIPSSITYVDNYAFVNNSIEHIELASSNITFGEDPFRFNFLQYITVPEKTATIMTDRLNNHVMGGSHEGTIILEGTTPIYQWNTLNWISLN